MRVNKYNKVQTDETNMRRIAIYLLCIFMLLPVATMTAQPGYNYSKLQREKLNRGVVAIRENPSEVIVSWRYLSSDPIQTGFNVYRDGKKLTDTPITVSTGSGKRIEVTGMRGWRPAGLPQRPRVLG